jgi:SAM-dependent methyltransferase
MDYTQIGEAEWGELWLRQAREGNVPGLPALAPEALQGRLHGTTGIQAMQGALAFRRRVLQTAGALKPNASMLDFGCGWGRHIRVFLKDFAVDRISGVDIDPANLDICRQLLPDIRFVQAVEGQALDLPDRSMDVIIAFSVFSHLNEASARFWLDELHRLLRPGGTAVVTSWGQAIFDIFDRLATTGELKFAWERNIDRSFPDKAETRRRYAAGEFVFGRHGSPGEALDPDVYGISLMPRVWVETQTPFRVIAYEDDPRRVPQTTFGLRRK